ncbi:hypothetical protein DFH09DRAFT_978497 [Mycena vulgaris]|nr:hypothetical protein DFH09DRAFT_978497 [Mycena vulgaris]
MAEPRFPPEIEIEIFETTALIHPTAIPALLRVAHRIRTWIEPLLYRVVRADKDPPYSDLTHAVLHAATSGSKPPKFLEGAVRHLFLDSSAPWSEDEALTVLRRCTGVINFAAIAAYSNPSILPILAGMYVQRFAVCLENLFGAYAAIDLTHGCFAFITHLDIFDTITEGETRICKDVPKLPALTHLCLNNDVPWDVVETLLTQCPRLELFVDLWPYTATMRAFGWAQQTPVSDVRFVVGVYHDYWADWETGARGGANFWSSADDFVARKRRGEIEAGFYWLG